MSRISLIALVLFVVIVGGAIAQEDEFGVKALPQSKLNPALRGVTRTTPAYVSIPGDVTDMILNATQVTGYKLGEFVVGHGGKAPLDSHDVLQFFRIVDAEPLGLQQTQVLAAAVANPEAHRLYATRGGWHPDFGFRFIDSTGTLEISVMFGENLWTFDWIGADGELQSISSRFDQVEGTLLSICWALFPEEPFAMDPPFWDETAKNGHAAKVPENFRIQDIDIEVLAARADYTFEAKVRGDGSSTLRIVDRGRVEGDFETVLTDSTVLRVFQALVWIGFFEMDDEYNLATKLKKIDETFELRREQEYPTLRIRVCCRIGDFQKCSKTLVSEPRELMRFMRDVRWAFEVAVERASN